MNDPTAVDPTATPTAAGAGTNEVAAIVGAPGVGPVLDALRRGPATAVDLARTAGMEPIAVASHLHRLVDAGLVVADAPRPPERETTYRWDGGALTGLRAWGRRRRRSDSEPEATAPETALAPRRRPLPSVAAWTNPAVAAALRRLDHDQAQHREERDTGPAESR